MSLDIETTGLSEHSDRIWSIGITEPNGAGWEAFSDPRDKSLSLSIDETFIKTSGEFGQAQIDRGSLNPLKDAINQNKVMEEGDLISEAFNRLKGKNILIQNANFENKMLAARLGTQDAGLSNDFRYNSVESTFPNKKLYTPPKISNLRREASRLRELGESPEAISSVYDNIFAEYEAEFKRADSKSVVVELMDFSRGVFTKAAAKGHLDEVNYDSNVKVDHLSKIFLGETELHTALSDGKQQESIFYRLLEINEELESGTISAKTSKEFSELKSTAKEATKTKFRSEITNIIGEIERDGSTRIIPSIPNDLMEIGIRGPDGIEKLEVPRYDTSRRTSDIGEAVAHITSKYANRLRGSDITSILGETSTSEDNMTKIKKVMEEFADSEPKAAPVINLEDSLPKIKGSTIKNLMIGGGVLALSASIYSGSTNRENGSEVEKEEKKKTILSQFDNQRFRTNEEINRHYEM